MTMGTYTSAAFESDSGVAVAAGAQVRVRRESDGALASIFEDREGVTPLSNPFNADSDGFFQFFAVGMPDGYRITVSKGSESADLRYQPIGTAQYYDVEDIDRGGIPITNAAVGTADDYTGDISETQSAYIENGIYVFTAPGTNDGPATLELTGEMSLGVVDLRKNSQIGPIPLAAGDLVEGNDYLLIYNQSTPEQLVVLNPSASPFKVGAFARDVSLASGNQIVSGVGFRPRAVIFLGVKAATTGAGSWGFDDGTSDARSIRGTGTTDQYTSNLSSIDIFHSTGNTAEAEVTSFNADGFTLAWTKTGAPTGTATILYLAFR